MKSFHQSKVWMIQGMALPLTKCRGELGSKPEERLGSGKQASVPREGSRHFPALVSDELVPGLESSSVGATARETVCPHGPGAGRAWASGSRELGSCPGCRVLTPSPSFSGSTRTSLLHSPARLPLLRKTSSLTRQSRKTDKQSPSLSVGGGERGHRGMDVSWESFGLSCPLKELRSRVLGSHAF